MSTVVTKSSGGVAQPTGALYIEPPLQLPDGSVGTVLADTGLDPAFLADLLSACLTHERCGVHLYRSVSARTADPELRAQYEHFEQETLEHVRMLEELVTAAGGNPQYVSAAARATEKAAAGLVESTFLLEGSIDPVTAELAMLEAVALAEAKDHANWELLDLLTTQMPDGPLRDAFRGAVDQVLPQEEEHFSWASDTRTQLLLVALGVSVTAPTAGSPGAAAATTAELASLSKQELYETAKELEIPGRSDMSKTELAEAIAEQTGEAQ